MRYNASMMIFGFAFDFWTIWGLAAQGLFFGSFLVQWWLSEQKKESYLPVEFWYLRLAGSGMLLLYVFIRRDIVFLLATVLQSFIYMRNIGLMKRNKS